MRGLTTVAALITAMTISTAAAAQPVYGKSIDAIEAESLAAI